MSELILDREHIRQLLLRNDFYAACPEFDHLQACAEDIRRAAAAKCGHCENDWIVYRNLLDAFFLRARTLDQTAIVRLKDYLATKKGYRSTSLVMYYQQGGGAGRVAVLKL